MVVVPEDSLGWGFAFAFDLAAITLMLVCEEKERGREKARDDPKALEEHSLVMSKRKILNGGKKSTEFGGPNERKATKACQKAMMASVRVVFALTRPTKVQARTFTKTKAEERIKEEKARKEPVLNLDSHLRNTQ